MSSWLAQCPKNETFQEGLHDITRLILYTTPIHMRCVIVSFRRGSCSLSRYALQYQALSLWAGSMFIDREAREIMYLVASVRPSVRPSVRMGSALPSAAKSNNHHYQSKVIVCVSVISRRRRIIARMRSIGF